MTQRTRAGRGRSDPWQPVRPSVAGVSLPADGSPRGPGQPWVIRGTIEDLGAAVADDPEADVLGGVRIESAVLASTRVLGGELAGLHLRDVLVDQAVLAGIVIDGGGGTRVEITGGRISGAVWIRGEFHDVVLDGVRADDVTLRSCTLGRARFSRCDLSRLDLTGSRLDHVRFEECDLTEAVFTDVAIRAASFRGCRFDGAAGVTGLTNAEVDADSLLTLTGPMAAALGISVV
ncbi:MULTISPECIES: pentapeptide repeat-containing protein [Parafrankia]|uniref:pentapeptide repeat-containing protein n=1 Tax=Parafrankia TaxID=2994362 RepID=UPI000B872633|nr:MULTISPECIES: pentapeptide repeat-containing protein [Parafrankia]MBE3203191.1 pentapeptide repeat-containing protein [Parafrankia sp. CH37]